MALCVDITGSSINVVTSQTELTCTAYLLQTVNEVRAESLALSSLTFETIGINATDILYVYTWGVGAVFFLWSLGYAIGVAKATIKKL